MHACAATPAALSGTDAVYCARAPCPPPAAVPSFFSSSSSSSFLPAPAAAGPQHGSLSLTAGRESTAAAAATPPPRPKPRPRPRPKPRRRSDVLADDGPGDDDDGVGDIDGLGGDGGELDAVWPDDGGVDDAGASEVVEGKGGAGLGGAGLGGGGLGGGGLVGSGVNVPFTSRGRSTRARPRRCSRCSPPPRMPCRWRRGRTRWTRRCGTTPPRRST